MHPFGNALVTLSLTGKQLRSFLEEQWTRGHTMLQVSEGFTYAWDATGPLGARVDPASMQLQGVPIEPQTTYRVTVNEFLATGGNGFTVPTHGLEQTRGVLDIQALEHYLGEHSPLAAPATNRITRRH